jgi:hypothetical protein
MYCRNVGKKFIFLLKLKFDIDRRNFYQIIRHKPSEYFFLEIKLKLVKPQSLTSQLFELIFIGFFRQNGKKSKTC